MYMTYIKEFNLSYENLKPKIVNIFWYDSKLWQIFKRKQKMQKQMHILKFSYLFNHD